MATTNSTDLIVDYLVVGAGISGLAFTDELLTRTDATSILLVDKRDRPGGHWVDAYPFVKLHGSSLYYGVESKRLGGDNIDHYGLNKGLCSLASAAEIQTYCASLVRDRFVNSGRVTFMPSTEYSNGTLRRTLSGVTLTVQIKKKLVDATFYDNRIPLLHQPLFKIQDGVTCIPPNHLPNTAQNFTNFTVIGGGKTGMDSCLWLLENGVDPERIRWVIPNDYWLLHRGIVEGRLENLVDTLKWQIEMYDSIAEGDTPAKLMLRLESIGVTSRFDRDIEPKQFRAALLTPREIEEIRRIKDVVRKEYVTSIGMDELKCTKGTVTSTSVDTLYIDCSASAIPDKPPVPVFQPDKNLIVLQTIRWPSFSYSASKIAFLESLPLSDEEKNYFALPIRYRKTVEEFVHDLHVDMENRVREQADPVLKTWLNSSRTDHFSILATQIPAEDTATIEAAQRMQQSFKKAYAVSRESRAGT